MRYDAQHTVERPVTVEGIGVHTGKSATATIRPAGAGVGIKFIRSDLNPGISVPAHYDSVCATDLCTVIGDGSGASISTVEHLLSALAAFGAYLDPDSLNFGLGTSPPDGAQSGQRCRGSAKGINTPSSVSNHLGSGFVFPVGSS